MNQHINPYFFLQLNPNINLLLNKVTILLLIPFAFTPLLTALRTSADCGSCRLSLSAESADAIYAAGRYGARKILLLNATRAAHANLEISSVDLLTALNAGDFKAATPRAVV